MGISNIHLTHSFSSRTCQRTDFNTLARPTGHNQLYFLDGFIINDLAARAANIYYQEVKKAFQKRDCQRAAGWLGAMAHVIADATFYGHVLSGTGRYSEFGKYVDYVTYKTCNDGDRNQEVGVTEFFDINEARNKLQSNLITYYDPYMATYRAAFDTYYGENGFKNAQWLYKYEPTNTDWEFWEDVEGVWTGYSRELLWTHSMRPDVLTHSFNCTMYFDTIEHNLNMAIYYTAIALNYALENGGYTDCLCSGENPPQEPLQPPDGKEPKDQTEALDLTLSEFQALFFFSTFGIISTATLLTMMSLVEKYLLKIPKMH